MIAMMGCSKSDLFRWPSAELYLVDGDERALLQRGPFTLFLAMHSRSPHLVAVEATVGDVQWPVGKDSLVTCFINTAPRALQRSFMFALQAGLVYELVFHDIREGTCLDMDRLQQLLGLYASINLFSGSRANARSRSLELYEEDARRNMEIAGPRTPERSTCIAETKVDTAELQLSLAGNGGGSRPQYCMQQEASVSMSAERDGATAIPARGAGAAISGASRRLMKRMHQARRISAVAKLFSKALARGAIRAETHIDQQPSLPEERQGGSTGLVPAVADVETVAKVVELVERRTTLREVVVKHEKRGVRGSWTLNEVGLHFLLTAVVAANMIAASNK